MVLEDLENYAKILMLEQERATAGSYVRLTGRGQLVEERTAAELLGDIEGVKGPAASTDNQVPRFDGVTGKLIQGSAVIVSDGPDVTMDGPHTYQAATTGGFYFGTTGTAIRGLVGGSAIQLQLEGNLEVVLLGDTAIGGLSNCFMFFAGSKIACLEWATEATLKVMVDSVTLAEWTSSQTTFTQDVDMDANTIVNAVLDTPMIGDLTNAIHSHQNNPGGGKIDHGAALNGLADDDHSIYALLGGRASGQTIKGGTAAGEHLLLQSTSDATRGAVKLLDNVVIGQGAADKDYTITVDGQSNDGLITWMEDEDYFKVGDDVLLDGTERLYFGSTGDYMYNDGTDLHVVSVNQVIVGAEGDIVLGSAADHYTMYPAGDDKVSLGKTGFEFRDGFFDGTVQTDALRIDEGGSTAISTGTGTVKMTTVNAANNAAWIPINYAGTVYYVPAWTTHAP